MNKNFFNFNLLSFQTLTPAKSTPVIHQQYVSYLRTIPRVDPVYARTIKRRRLEIQMEKSPVAPTLPKSPNANCTVLLENAKSLTANKSASAPWSTQVHCAKTTFVLATVTTRASVRLFLIITWASYESVAVHISGPVTDVKTRWMNAIRIVTMEVTVR